MNEEHPLWPRLSPLLEQKPEHLEGPDAQHWEIEIETDLPQWMARDLPEGSLVFASNGAGDILFLSPDASNVMVFWHEGAQIEEYCSAISELRPDHHRPPSDHPPINYRNTEERVQLGDFVIVRYWLLFKDRGRVVYVPGVSPKKPSMERDGLAWVGIKLDDGSRVDTIVMPDGALKKTVTLVSRDPRDGGDEPASA